MLDPTNKYAPTFFRWLQVQKIPEPIAEYRFAYPRKWRFDFAWGDAQVALEWQGGIFVRGRHSRGAGMLRDYEKFNRAATLGWRVLYCTPSQLLTQDMADVIRAALGSVEVREVRP